MRRSSRVTVKCRDAARFMAHSVYICGEIVRTCTQLAFNCYLLSSSSGPFPVFCYYS